MVTGIYFRQFSKDCKAKLTKTYCDTEDTVPLGKTSKAFTAILRLSFPPSTKHPGVHKLSK